MLDEARMEHKSFTSFYKFPVTDVEISDLNVTYIITFKVVNKHDNDELLDEASLERLKDTFAFIENLKFRYEIAMYHSVNYE